MANSRASMAEVSRSALIGAGKAGGFAAAVAGGIAAVIGAIAAVFWVARTLALLVAPDESLVTTGLTIAIVCVIGMAICGGAWGAISAFPDAPESPKSADA